MPPVDPGSLGAIVAILAAMGGILKLILSHLDKESKRHDEEMGAQRQQFTTFLGNHMSHNTKAMEDVARQLTELTREVRYEHRKPD